MKIKQTTGTIKDVERIVNESIEAFKAITNCENINENDWDELEIMIPEKVLVGYGTGIIEEPTVIDEADYIFLPSIPGKTMIMTPETIVLKLKHHKGTKLLLPCMKEILIELGCDKEIDISTNQDIEVDGYKVGGSNIISSDKYCFEMGTLLYKKDDELFKKILPDWEYVREKGGIERKGMSDVMSFVDIGMNDLIKEIIQKFNDK